MENSEENFQSMVVRAVARCISLFVFFGAGLANASDLSTTPKTLSDDYNCKFTDNPPTWASKMDGKEGQRWGAKANPAERRARCEQEVNFKYVEISHARLTSECQHLPDNNKARGELTELLHQYIHNDDGMLDWCQWTFCAIHNEVARRHEETRLGEETIQSAKAQALKEATAVGAVTKSMPTLYCAQALVGERRALVADDSITAFTDGYQRLKAAHQSISARLALLEPKIRAQFEQLSQQVPAHQNLAQCKRYASESISAMRSGLKNMLAALANHGASHIKDFDAFRTAQRKDSAFYLAQAEKQGGCSAAAASLAAAGVIDPPRCRSSDLI